MSFYVGQKVVCVDAENTAGKRWLDDEAPVEGAIYTIVDMSLGKRGLFLRFREVERCAAVQKLAALKGRNFSGYAAYRFRPAVEPKTDISIFKALLNPTPEKIEELWSAE